MEEQLSLEVSEPSAVGHVRRLGAELARQAGFTERDAGRVALVATELAGNASAHGRDGEAVWRMLELPDGSSGLELVVLDRGPGMADIAGSLRDGYSTAGTSGTGLGAARRLADEFDIHSMPSVGTAIVAEFRQGGGPRLGRLADGSAGLVSAALPAGEQDLHLGAVSVPKPGETVNGDAWASLAGPGRVSVLVVDGLGHGPQAARAAQAAVRAFRTTGAVARGPADALARVHAAMAETRGAAGAIAEVDLVAGRVRYAGIGNISSAVVDQGSLRSMVSMNGILGHGAPRFLEFEYPCPAGSLLVMHSDGCRSHWQLSRYPGLTARHPSLIAAVLYRDWRRGTDDVTVVVGRVADGARL